MTNKEKCDHLVRNHKANKELMELGFGCKVMYRIGNNDPIFGYVVGSNNSDWTYVYVGQCAEDKEIVEKNYSELQILGKPPHLEHYLRVLGEEYDVKLGGKNELILKRHTGGDLLNFNLTTGAPATEEDAEAFIRLVERV